MLRRIEVAETRTIPESVTLLLNGLVAKIEVVRGDPSQLDLLLSEIRASADELGAAVIANVPVYPASPVPVDRSASKAAKKTAKKATTPGTTIPDAVPGKPIP